MKRNEKERKGMKRNDFLQNSLIFSEILCFSLFFSVFPRIFNKIPYICIGFSK